MFGLLFAIGAAVLVTINPPAFYALGILGAVVWLVVRGFDLADWLHSGPKMDPAIKGLLTCIGIVVAMFVAAALLKPTFAHAANYDFESKPFAIVCSGILKGDNKSVRLEVAVPKDDYSSDAFICSAADRIDAHPKYRVKYMLAGDKPVFQVLNACTVGKPCRFSGLMKGVGYDVYYWVRLDKVSAD